MLFANIQLDDFAGTLACFLERLGMEGEKCGWIMMGVVNIGIGAILEYDRASSVVRRAVTAVQASPATSEVDEAASAMADEYLILFKLAAQLTFAMLSHVLRHLAPKPSPSARSALNPYLTFTLTFLATLKTHRSTRCPQTVNPLGMSWPGSSALFLTTSWPQGLNKTGDRERLIMLMTGLTTGCAPPLAEDWCLCGMEESSKEVEVLDAGEGEEVTDGIIEVYGF
jgi:protein SMG6